MNWKNVVRLMGIDRKSGRLLRRTRLTRYRENRWFTYLEYGGALAIGLAVGALAGFVYESALSTDPTLTALVDQGMLSLLLTLPTLVLIYSLVLTMMQQIQRSGAKFSIQAPYWLPITWGEHTLASILANLLGFPLISVVFIASALTLFSTFTGQLLPALATIPAICAAAFMASAITEVFRILQVRFIGAVYRSTGRAAVWVRFVGSLLFFLVFYIIYFYLVSGSGAQAFVQGVAAGQTSVWFIPFVWLGMTLSSFTNGLLLQGFAFVTLSILFILGLFYLAALLNRRFGLYEPPAITVSRGVYAPRTGFLGRLGFSAAEAALIRKDLKAFTRRRELMFIFIVPIVVVIAPLVQSFGSAQTQTPPEASVILFAVVFLFPAALMALTMGTLMIGEEGQAVWRVYSSPVSAGSLVKSKYFLIVFLSILVMVVTGIAGTVLFHPSLRAVTIAALESLFLVCSLGAISLTDGIRGADFSEVPRPRMIRASWTLINLVACLLAAVALLIPFVPYMLSSLAPGLIGPFLDLYQATAVSSIIAATLTVIFYRIALREARDLIRRAEI